MPAYQVDTVQRPLNKCVTLLPDLLISGFNDELKISKLLSLALSVSAGN